MIRNFVIKNFVPVPVPQSNFQRCLGSNPDISKKYELGDLSKGGANTQAPLPPKNVVYGRLKVPCTSVIIKKNILNRKKLQFWTEGNRKKPCKKF